MFCCCCCIGQVVVVAVVWVQGEVMSRVGVVALVRCNEGEKDVSTRTAEEAIKREEKRRRMKGTKKRKGKKEHRKSKRREGGKGEKRRPSYVCQVSMRLM